MPCRCPVDALPRLLTAVMIPCLLAAQVTATQVDDAVADAFQPLIYQSPLTGESLPYRLLKPKSIEPDGKYPLVLFLHGAGERGADNKLQLGHGADQFARDERRDKYPAFVVFPQCPADKRWVESDWGLPTGRGEFDDEPSDPMRLTLELVDQLTGELPVDTNRMFVTGLSMGGMGAWFAAQAKPKRFTAMLQVCGGGDPTWADRYAGISMWIFHGQADDAVPVTRNREMVAALASAGHHPELRYTEYPGVNHNSWTQTYRRDDVFKWLFAQHK